MNNKKKYEAPEMKVYQVQKANIIATSGSLKTDEASFEGYENGQFSW